MSQYYYLVASLPTLLRRERPPLTSEEILEMCGRLMSPGDFAQIRLAQLNAAASPPARCGLLRRFRAAEMGLRNELAKLRAREAGVALDRYVRPAAVDPAWAGAAREIFEQDTPLKAEQLLGSVLWGLLDTLVVGHFFDVDFLAAYHLKTQILERDASFVLEAGRLKLESILSGEAMHA